MRILHFIPTYAPAWSFGGPVRSVSQLCEALASLGHSVEVVTTTAGTDIDAGNAGVRRVSRSGVTVYYCKRDRGFGIASRAVRSCFRDRLAGAEIAHITGVWQRTSRAAYRDALTAGVPYVSSPRGALSPYSFTRGTLKKRVYFKLVEEPALRRAAAVHVTSRQEASEIRALACNQNIFTVPNAVDPRAWYFDDAERVVTRTALGVADGDLLLLVAGRMHHKKGLDFVARLLPSLQRARWRLMLVGHDEDGSRAALLQSLAERGLHGRTTVIEHVSPEVLRTFYAASDVLLLPSRHENFGNVIVEALACGTAAAASRSVGAAEDLGREDGVVVFSDDLEEWCNALDQLQDSARTSPARRQVASRIAGALAPEAVAQRMLECYARCLSSTRSSAVPS